MYKIKFTEIKFYRKLRNADQFDGGDTSKYPDCLPYGGT